MKKAVIIAGILVVALFFSLVILQNNEKLTGFAISDSDLLGREKLSDMEKIGVSNFSVSSGVKEIYFEAPGRLVQVNYTNISDKEIINETLEFEGYIIEFKEKSLIE